MKILSFPQENLKKGILYTLIGWFCFACLYALSKVVDEQTNLSTVLFFRSLVGLLFASAFVLPKWKQRGRPNSFKGLFFLSSMSVLNIFLVLLSINYISLVNATLLDNTAAFFVPIIALVCFKTKIEPKAWVAILLGFIGVMFILGPSKGIIHIGALYGLLAGLTLALYIVAMRLNGEKEELFTFLFYFYLIAVVSLLPFLLYRPQIDNCCTLLALIAMGVLSLSGQVALFHGLKFGKVHQLAPICYSLVVFSGIFEWILWGQVPKPLAYVGIVCIVAAGVWITQIGRLPKKMD